MEIHKISDTGVALKDSSTVVGINTPEKLKKSLTPNILLETFSVPIGNWAPYINPEEDQIRFSGAGEYERNGIIIQGFSSLINIGKQDLQATLWNMVIDEVNVVWTDGIQEKDNVIHALNEIGDIDVLIVACTKDAEASPKNIQQYVAQSSPSFVVLVGDDKKLIEGVSKEIGEADRVDEKVSIKKKSCTGTTKLIVLG